jgi:phage FluMu gp28-like protein
MPKKVGRQRPKASATAAPAAEKRTAAPSVVVPTTDPLVVNGVNASGFFLPYQVAWLRDESPIKIWEKSRRIGATYIQSYEDVRDLLKHKYDVWFSSADESAALEYILYAQKWAKIFHAASKYLGITIIDPDKDIKAHVIEFTLDGELKRINALSSKPRRFRSKGGKVVLDEFAWHDDQDGMWAAAEPTTTWGYPIRVLSTHNGKACTFYKFTEDCKRGELKDDKNWSLHTTTLQDAVAQGLLDKILGRATSDAERAEWLRQKEKRTRNKTRWLQEYCCVPVDEATAFLTYDMIDACERKGLLIDPSEIKGELYIGMDIGRKRNLSVIWGLERIGHGLYTRFYEVMEKTPFRIQREKLFSILRHTQMRRCCIDSTGLGMQLAEEAREEFGKSRVEEITFTSAVEDELASDLLPWVEDKNLFIPNDQLIRDDLHSIRKIETSAHHARYAPVKTDEEDTHADRFWALALAVHAGGLSKSKGPVTITSRATRESSKIITGY